MKSRKLLIAASLAFSMTQASHGASGTWNSVATDGNWHTATNWSGGSAPNAAADIATFNSGSNFTAISIGSTTTTVDRINFSGASTAAYTFTGTSSTNMVMSTNGGGVFIDSSVTTNQDLSGIPIIRPGMDDTINFSNQGSGFLKLGTFQAHNATGSLSTMVFKPGASGNIEIVSGKLINNAGTGNLKKIAIVLDDVGTLKIAATGSYDGSNADGNSVSIYQGTLQAAVIKNSGTSSSLGGGGRIQFGKASTTNTATLDYYGASDTTDRVFHIIDNNTAVFKVSGGSSTNLSITSAITQSGSASGGGKLTKDGVGILTLSGINTYTGGTTVNQGTLKLDLGARSGNATLGSFAVAANAALNIDNTNTTVGSLYPSAFILSGAGTVSKTNVGSIDWWTDSDLTGFTGTIDVQGGAVRLNNLSTGKAYMPQATLNVAGGATFDLRYSNASGNNLTVTVDKLTGSGIVDHSYNKSGTYNVTVGASDGSSQFDGTLQNSATTTGVLSLTKTGSGTFTLTGTNTYSGDTTVNGGKLIIGTGGSLGSTAVTVGGATASDTPTLGGVGTIGGNTLISSASGGMAGTHAPGLAGVAAGVGTQAFSGDLTYGDGSIFEWDINANKDSTTGTAGTDFDNVTVSGNLTGSTGLETSIFRVVFGTTAKAGIEDSGNAFWNTASTSRDWSMTSLFGKDFTTGMFTSVQTYDADGVYDVSTKGTFSITGSTLTWTAVPEPTSALAGLLLTAGLLRRRRA